MQSIGFIFDMDGTMVDNMMTHHRAWQKMLAEEGIFMTLEEVKDQIHGKNEEILERLFGNRFTPDERKALAYRKEAYYRDIFLPDLQLVDGLLPFLEAASARNIPLSIATAAPPENVQFVLNNLPIRHFFNPVIDASMVNKGKPDPEVLSKAAQGMGIPLNQCVVFEDSVVGAEAARRGGCTTFIVTSTHTAEEFEGFKNVVRTMPNFTNLHLAEVIRLHTNRIIH